MMLTNAAIIAFIVFAIHATMWKEAIFGFIRKWGETHLSERMQQPVYDCPICMTPWYGSVVYWLVFGLWLGTASWPDYIVVIICAMGINAVFIKLFPKD